MAYPFTDEETKYINKIVRLYKDVMGILEGLESLLKLGFKLAILLIVILILKQIYPAFEWIQNKLLPYGDISWLPILLFVAISLLILLFVLNELRTK